MKVKVNIITGFLGVGKTTAVNHLLKNKPSNEKWAILVNEFGSVPIDQVILNENISNEVFIKDIPGGCICCTMNLPLKVALVEILRKVKPDRIVIEPTGIGHPAQIIDILKDKDLINYLDIRATICLINPKKLSEINLVNSTTFFDQVIISDVLVANKTDLATVEEINQFKIWSENLFPPKNKIIYVQKGKIDFDLLNIIPNQIRNLKILSHHHSHLKNDIDISINGNNVIESKKPQTFIDESEDFKAFGLIFSSIDTFNYKTLTETLKTFIKTERFKGIFKTNRGYLLINVVDGFYTADPVNYNNDSRAELIYSISEKPDIEDFKLKLISCINV